MNTRSKSIHILVVDDDPEFRSAINHVHNDLLSLSKITFKHDGVLALEFLHNDVPPDFEHRPVDLVLLDVNMPGMSGHEILEAIRKHPKTRTLPVIIISNSEAETDINKAYDQGATSYVAKPRTVQALRQMMLQIDGFWSHSAKLPSDPR